MSLQQICDLNNEGGRLLAAGKPHDALVSLEAAQLIATRPFRATGAQPKLASAGTLSITPLEITPSGTGNTISVPKALLCFGADSTDDVPVVYAILHFNIGLALQFQVQFKQDQRMGRIVDEYKKCLRHLRACSSTDPAQVVGLSVAAIANLAEVLFDLDRSEKAAALIAMGNSLLETEPTVPIIDDEIRYSIACTEQFFSHYCEMQRRGAPAA